MPPLLLITTVAFVASVFMAWSIGANSNSAPFAPAVGANALPVMRAALLVGIFASLGAVLQGASISDTVGKELIRNTTISPLGAASGLLTAATFITVGNRRGYPIPAAFTVTGAMIGVGLSLGGDPATAKYQEIAIFWLIIPFVGSSVGFTTAYLLRRDDIPESVSVPILSAVVGFVIANIRLSFIPTPKRDQGSFAGYASRSLDLEAPELFSGYDAVMFGTSLVFGIVAFLWFRRSIKKSTERGIRWLLISLGSVVVFSSGGTQVGLATGPLETLFSDLGLPGIYLLILGGGSILAGAWMGAPRVIQAVSREYSSLGVRRSISALVPSFLIAQTAIFLGLPVSANETIISSVIGSGLVEGSSGVSAKKISYTVGVWVFSLFAACAVAYGLHQALSALLGT